MAKSLNADKPRLLDNLDFTAYFKNNSCRANTGVLQQYV